MKDWHFVTIKNRDSIEVRIYEGGENKPTRDRLTFTHELTDAEMHDLHVKLAEILWNKTRKLP